MWDFLLWVYVLNATLLINHEIDSSYWKEWNLILSISGRSNNVNIDQKNMNFFLLLHIPLIFLIMYGLKEIIQESFIGLIISIVLCFGGFFAFFFHMHFIRKGRIEFNTPISKIMIVGIFILSIIQLIIAFWITMS
ncbi:hypothetical protein A3K80_00935 [Candidatus Bathyarchaeota archaeon RBG_13_38_9]|nr:MAG: hypothetical protein A3K80_00935 [Candidatus Bathyarchaeota archaeon RBG_13_38_9]